MILSKTHTSEACPSQWMGKLSDERMFYIRYRWGYLSVRVSRKKTDDLMDAVGGEEVYGEQLGEDLDGMISWDDIPKEALEKL